VRRLSASALPILVLASATCDSPPSGGAEPAPDVDWPSYGNDAGGTKYSPVADISRSNVTALRVAWTTWVGGANQGVSDPTGVRDEYGVSVGVGGARDAVMCERSLRGDTPDGQRQLYIATPYSRVLALDPATGSIRWAFVTYRVGGRQYVVIAAGGRGGIGSPGNWLVAFALPDD
jgi:quinoprotein glucose dehydrogenase